MLTIPCYDATAGLLTTYIPVGYLQRTAAFVTTEIDSHVYKDAIDIPVASFLQRRLLRQRSLKPENGPLSVHQACPRRMSLIMVSSPYLT